MTNIKKAFVSIYTILEANKSKLPKGLYESLMNECTSKTLAQTFRTNEDGNLEVFCWYHKEWEDTTTVEYGSKSGTKTGLNTFCKQGVSSWTKQQRIFKTSKEDILNQLMEGKIKQEDIADKLAMLESDASIIIPRK